MYDCELRPVQVFDRPILGKVLILSRSLAKEFVYDKPWACISIASHESEFPPINATQRVDWLKLVFADAEYERQTIEAPLIQPEQAREIIKFVENVWNNIDLLVIHCYAGLSRSPAVGQFVSEVYQPEYATWFEQLYSPNKLVHRTLKEVFGESTKSEEGKETADTGL